MHDRQLRLAQRHPVQVSPIPSFDTTITRGGVAMTLVGETRIVNTGGITLVSGKYTASGPTTGAFAVTVPELAGFPDQMAGQLGFVGTNSWADFLKLSSGVLSTIGAITDQAGNDGMILSFSATLMP